MPYETAHAFNSEYERSGGPFPEVSNFETANIYNSMDKRQPEIRVSTADSKSHIVESPLKVVQKRHTSLKVSR